jgi:hypothetical protein
MNKLLHKIVFGVSQSGAGGLLYNKEKLWWDWKVWFEGGDLGGRNGGDRRVLSPRSLRLEMGVG